MVYIVIIEIIFNFVFYVDYYMYIIFGQKFCFGIYINVNELRKEKFQLNYVYFYWFEKGDKIV